MVKLLLMMALCCMLASCMSVKKAKKHYARVVEDSIKVDALIVPGLAFNNPDWPTLMKRRVIWSWILYRQGICKYIIYSGGAVYTPFIEAYVMGLYAQQLGVPHSAIFYDTMAQHSTENVYYAYLIAKQQKFKSIALGTDRYQSSFLKRFMRRRFKTQIHMMPVVKDTVEKYMDFKPQIDTLRAKVKNPQHFRSIRQREKLVHRMRGTHGMNIPWYKHPDGKVEAL